MDFYIVPHPEKNSINFVIDEIIPKFVGRYGNTLIHTSTPNRLTITWISLRNCYLTDNVHPMLLNFNNIK